MLFCVSIFCLVFHCINSQFLNSSVNEHFVYYKRKQKVHVQVFWVDTFFFYDHFWHCVLGAEHRATKLFLDKKLRWSQLAFCGHPSLPSGLSRIHHFDPSIPGFAALTCEPPQQWLPSHVLHMKNMNKMATPVSPRFNPNLSVSNPPLGWGRTCDNTGVCSCNQVLITWLIKYLGSLISSAEPFTRLGAEIGH